MLVQAAERRGIRDRLVEGPHGLGASLVRRPAIARFAHSDLPLLRTSADVVTPDNQNTGSFFARRLPPSARALRSSAAVAEARLLRPPLIRRRRRRPRAVGAATPRTRTTRSGSRSGTGGSPP